MKLAISLLRVSSDRQYQEGQGIDVQKQANDFFAKRNDYVIVRYFLEHFSGRKADRQVLDEIIQFAAEHEGEVSALIVSQIDRFTRAGADVYLYLQKQLRALGVELLDASGVIQKPVNTLEHTGFEYEWSVRSPSRLTETILAEHANAEATQILTRCIGGQIESAKKGYQFKSADYGFKNVKMVTSEGRRRTILAREESEAVFIEMMFKLRSEGQLSDQTICDQLNQAGYRSRSFRRYDPITREVIGEGGGVALTVKQLHLYISRPIYCGIRVGKWTHEEPIWLLPECDRLVTIEIFNRANRGYVRLTDTGGGLHLEKNVRRYQQTKDTRQFCLRHVILCPECQTPFKASKSKGRSGQKFGYYHCNRNHKYLGINQQVFEDTVAKLVHSITFKKKLFGLLKEVTREIWIEYHQADAAMKMQTQAHIDGLKDRQQQLLDRIGRSQSEAVQIALEKEYETLEETLKKASKQLVNLGADESQIEEYFHALKQAVEHPAKWLLKPQSKPALQNAWGFVFESPPTWADIESRTARLSLPFRLLSRSEIDEGQLVELLSAGSNQVIEHIQRFCSR